nr:immunoglobulin heavy chain junction region [Mus musculus]
ITVQEEDCVRGTSM